jgi:hypothetical protein
MSPLFFNKRVEIVGFVKAMREDQVDYEVMRDLSAHDMVENPFMDFRP